MRKSKKTQTISEGLSIVNRTLTITQVFTKHEWANVLERRHASARSKHFASGCKFDPSHMDRIQLNADGNVDEITSDNNSVSATEFVNSSAT